MKFCLVPIKVNAAPLPIIIRRVKNAENNFKENKYDLALNKLKKAQSECEMSNCDKKLKKRIKKGILNAHYGKINTLYDEGVYNQVVKACDIAIYEAQNNVYFKIRFLRKLAESLSIMNLKDELNKTFKDIYKLNMSFNEKDWILWSAYYENIRGIAEVPSGISKQPVKPTAEPLKALSPEEIDEVINHLKELIKRKGDFQTGGNTEDVPIDDYNKAIRKLEKIEKKLDRNHVRWAKVKETLGDAYKIGKKYIRAIKKFESIINYDVPILLKEKISLINKLCVLYLKLENPRPEKAMPILSEALMSSPDNGTSLYLMGKTMYYQKEYKKAISYYRSSLKINPVNPEVYMSLANVYEKLDNRRHDALVEYENAVALSTDKKEKINNSIELAKVYQRLNMLKASLEQWKKILETTVTDKIKREAEKHIKILKRNME
jgi:tetratricopeptide (TPR) repeat protein